MEPPNGIQHPPPLASSDHHTYSIADTLAQLSITGSAKIGTNSNAHTLFHASADDKLFMLQPPSGERTMTHVGERTSRTGSKNNGVSTSSKNMSEELCTPNQASENVKESSEIDILHHKSSSTATKSVDKLAHDQSGHRNLSGFEITTTTPTPSEPTIPPPNPPTAPELIKDSGSGMTESQTTALGSDSLVYNHMRNPSLLSSSSIDSTDDSCTSSEINPIQVSEQKEGECYPVVTGGGIRPASCSKGVEKQKRQRCKHCAKLKKESNALKEELHKVQRTVSREREQNDSQVADFKEQLFLVEQQAHYQLTQYVRHSELRHQAAARTIQKLQRELQQIEKEKECVKNAYDCCLERFQTFKTEL